MSTRKSDEVEKVGVQPTTPESDPIPVKLQDAAGNAQGVAGNPLVTTTPVGTTVITEDSGKNTNRRKYEQDHAFRSQVLTLTGPPEALYTLTTDPARTAGERVFIYVITVFSSHGNTIGQVGLEQPVGTEIYPRISIDEEETAVVCLETPIPVGVTGVFARPYRGTTVIGVDVQILGLEC